MKSKWKRWMVFMVMLGLLAGHIQLFTNVAFNADGQMQQEEQVLYG